MGTEQWQGSLIKKFLEINVAQSDKIIDAIIKILQNQTKTTGK